MSNLKLELKKYLVITPDKYLLCKDIRHVICSIRNLCYTMNGMQLKCFNKSISRQVEKRDFRNPIKKEGYSNKYIKEANIYVIPLDGEELKMFYK